MWLPTMVYPWDKNTMRMYFSCLHTIHPAHVALVGASSHLRRTYTLYMTIQHHTTNRSKLGFWKI